MLKKKKIELTEEEKEEIRIKDFFDRVLPSTIKFMSDHYIVGDTYHCVLSHPAGPQVHPRPAHPCVTLHKKPHLGTAPASPPNRHAGFGLSQL